MKKGSPFYNRGSGFKMMHAHTKTRNIGGGGPNVRNSHMFNIGMARVRKWAYSIQYSSHFFKNHLKARGPPGAGPRARALFAYRLTGPCLQPCQHHTFIKTRSATHLSMTRRTVIFQTMNGPDVGHARDYLLGPSPLVCGAALWSAESVKTKSLHRGRINSTVSDIILISTVYMEDEGQGCLAWVKIAIPTHVNCTDIFLFKIQTCW